MKLSIHLLPITFLFFFYQTIYSQSLAQWRGPNRDGIYPEKDLLHVWPESGPRLLWSTETLGNGYSSPVLDGNSLYINGEIDSVSYVFAFDKSGRLLWKTANGPEFMGEGYASNFPGSRSAPTVVNDLLYACRGMGRMVCLETA